MSLEYTKHIEKTFSYSWQEAERLGNNYVGPEHLLLGLIRDSDGNATNILNELSIDRKEVKKEIEKLVRTTPNPIEEKITLLKSTEKIKKIMELEARLFSAQEVDTAHLLLALLKDQKGLVANILEKESLTYEGLIIHLNKAKNNLTVDTASELPIEEDDEQEEPFANRPTNRTGRTTRKAPENHSDTPALDTFGTDITQAARENKLDPVIGRDKEIERLAQILSRRKKNNPVLIGEPGVGKSAIVEGLALRIVHRKVPRILYGKRVVALDIATIVAGTKYRGQFEERIKAILNELQKTPNIILFIDEIHTIVGAGGAQGSLDAANMLKPALARGEVQCVGATTLDEYRKTIEKDGALERRFQKVIVEPTTAAETLEILTQIQDRYEYHHNVKYTEEAIQACVRLTDRYVSERKFPDKAIDALDEAGARTHISSVSMPKHIDDLEKRVERLEKEKGEVIERQQYEDAVLIRDQIRNYKLQITKAIDNWEKEQEKKPEIVDEQKVAEVVAMMTGVPVQRIAQAEGLKLKEMKNRLMERVIGQQEAVEKITKAIQRNRLGLKDPNKPIGSFLFLGATGVGKTHLARTLAALMFDSPDALIRIDMSEYMEKYSVSRMIGAPPGYVGHEDGGQLTEKVRRKPYAIVLLDEIEKAHPDVFNILLQVMDEGRLTDSLGRNVDFKNTIIIMTSNVGTRQLKDFGKGVGFDTTDPNQIDKDYARGIINKSLHKTFSPEFLNRVDDVIMFDQLSKESIEQIIGLELESLYQRVAELGYQLKLTEVLIDFIADKGYDIQYGARPLKRAIQKYIEDELADVVLSGLLKEGDTILVTLDEDKKEVKTEILQVDRV